MMLNRYTFEIKPATCRPRNDHSIHQVGDYLYSPTDQIGLGFISNVYLGRQKQTSKPVAIKIINTAKQDALGMQLLQEEINALEKIKRFNCKNLLHLETHFTKDDKLYIVTEYCEGKDIAKLLREHKKFNQTQAQTIMKMILQAYAQVYELGLVHRDLKLSNLLVKNGKVKLADFGFSVQIVNCIDQFSYNAGSPYYMPPQSLKRNRFTFKSDVWALGVMAYELIYGQLPFREKVDSLQYQKIMSSKIQDIFINRQEPSPTYKSFIIQCMQIDMQKRATPQFVINYFWPEAKSTLGDLFQEGRRMSVTERPRPRLQTNLSTTHLRPVLSAINSPISSSPTYKRTHIEFTQKDFTRGSQQNKTVFQPQVKLTNFTRNHQHTLTQANTERPSIRSVNQQHSMRAQHRNGHQIQNNGSFQELMRKIEALVHCQMSYCNFLYKLILLVATAPYLPQGNVLCRYFSHKITSICCELMNLMNGASNRFSNVILGPQLMIDQTYFKMRREVDSHMLMYQHKLDSYKGNVPQSSILLRSIRYLSENMRSNYKLLFWLCEQFELQQMQRQHNAEYFLKHSNITQLSKLDLGKQIEVSQNEILRLKARVEIICSTLMK